MISFFDATALKGIPEAIPLAMVMISGTTPKCSEANHLPVLPIPDCTSSKIRRTPHLSQKALNLLRTSRGEQHIRPLQDRLDNDACRFFRRDEMPEEVFEVSIAFHRAGIHTPAEKSSGSSKDRETGRRRAEEDGISCGI